MYERYLRRRVRTVLADTPVLALVGPRQSGKTTLARQLAAKDATYVTLDDKLVRDSAIEDPTGFLRDLDTRSTLIIDEIQKAPDLMPAIKSAVDRDRRPGRFFLTGSAQLFTLPRIRESLAGRMEVLTLYPLSYGEITRQPPRDVLTEVFETRPRTPSSLLSGHHLVDAALKGGFPEVVARRDQRRRVEWHRAYVSALVERDIRDVAAIENAQALRKLVGLTASVSGQLLVASALGAKVDLDVKTVQRYCGLLEQLYVFDRLPAWSDNVLKRAVSTAKLQFIDSGLLASLRVLTLDKLRRDRKLVGPLLESFVYSELLKCSTWSDTPVNLFHYRDKDQLEVDFVVEHADGRLVGIEVKAGASVSSADFRAMRRLQGVYGDRFVRGLLLYDGERVASFGEGLHAVPISWLWS